jgi:hypothetical protein
MARVPMEGQMSCMSHLLQTPRDVCTFHVGPCQPHRELVNKGRDLDVTRQLHVGSYVENVLYCSYHGQVKAPLFVGNLMIRMCVGVQSAGTFMWTAPEVLLYGRATYSADVFSYGVVLW